MGGREERKKGESPEQRNERTKQQGECWSEHGKSEAACVTNEERVLGKNSLHRQDERVVRGDIQK